MNLTENHDLNLIYIYDSPNQSIHRSEFVLTTENTEQSTEMIIHNLVDLELIETEKILIFSF